MSRYKVAIEYTVIEIHEVESDKMSDSIALQKVDKQNMISKKILNKEVYDYWEVEED